MQIHWTEVNHMSLRTLSIRAAREKGEKHDLASPAAAAAAARRTSAHRKCLTNRDFCCICQGVEIGETVGAAHDRASCGAPSS